MENKEVISTNISAQDKKYIRRILAVEGIPLDTKIDILSKELDLTPDNLKNIITELNLSLTNSQFTNAKLRELKASKRYIISSAQNSSIVNFNFLVNIEAYANFIGAEIGIIPTRYKNPTSIFMERDKGNDVWDHAIDKYLTAKRQILHNNLMLLADLKIQATSPNPTNGIELFGDYRSLIVGAPKIEMVSVPVLPTMPQKFLYSTGSITFPNFTESVAGGKAGEHHSFGFVVVEIENDDIVHIRTVSAEQDGSFNDLVFRVEKGAVIEESVGGLVWGDSHFAQKDPKVTDAFRGLCKDLKIHTSVLHDVWDSKSINVHNIDDPYIQFQLLESGENNLSEEIDQMFEELNWFEENMTTTYVISSNHDDMLDRALKIPNFWSKNLVNAKTILRFMSMKLEGLADDGIINYLISDGYDNVETVSLNDSLVINGIELGLHGHKGPNGSRGGIKTFSKLPFKTITGHSHSPGICGGAYQVGVSCSLDHGYNQGLSNWAYAGCTFNEHGKRQIIVFNKDSLTYTTLL